MADPINESVIAGIIAEAKREGREVVREVGSPGDYSAFMGMILGKLTMGKLEGQALTLVAKPDETSCSLELCESEFNRRPALQFTVVDDPDRPALQSVTAAANWFASMLATGNRLVAENAGGSFHNPWIQMPRNRTRPGFGVRYDAADEGVITVFAVPHAVSRVFDFAADSFKGDRVLDG